MKRFFLLMVAGVCLTGCDVLTVDSIDRDDVDCWNDVGVWRKVAGTPHDYVPSDYKEHPSSKPSAGQWVVDPQDGWRFYIPDKGTPQYSGNVLRSEVTKSLNAYTKEQQRFHNAAEVLTMPVHVVGAPFRAMGSALGSSSSSRSERISESKGGSSHHSESKGSDSKGSDTKSK